ncbi:MAG: hypothetical protein LBG86_00365 [Puniceicoccales bacterium]|nr:hypothetical protein [Puniceicoccales bacterium]
MNDSHQQSNENTAPLIISSPPLTLTPLKSEEDCYGQSEEGSAEESPNPAYQYYIGENLKTLDNLLAGPTFTQEHANCIEQIRSMYCNPSLEGEKSQMARNLAEKFAQTVPTNDRFHFYSIDEIMKIHSSDESSIEPKLCLLKGLGADRIGKYFSNTNHINVCPISGQFDYQENVSCRRTSHFNEWVGDRTYGPQASLQAVSTAALRNIRYCGENNCSGSAHDDSETVNGRERIGCMFDPLLKLPITNDATSIDFDTFLKKYPDLFANGFFQPYSLIREPDAKDELCILSKFFQKNCHKLNMLIYWAPCNESKQIQLQIVNSATAYQGLNSRSKIPLEYQSVCNEIDATLLSCQYVADAIVAAELAKMHKKQEVNLLLPLTGMGSFRNDISTITVCLVKMFPYVVHARVNIYFMAYSDSDVTYWKNAVNGIEDEKIKDFYRKAFQSISEAI